MINIEGKTKLSTDEVMKRLKKYFGQGGQGLQISEENPSCITFEGGGGSVTVMRDLDTGRSRGFAFVEMRAVEAAQKAFTELNCIADFGTLNWPLSEL